MDKENVSVEEALASAMDVQEQVEAEPETAEPEPELDLETGPDELAPEALLAEQFDDAERSGQLQAPEHWSDDDKAFLSRLPNDDVRQQVLDWRTQIETGAQSKFDEASKVRAEAESAVTLVSEIDRHLAPFDAEMKQHGMTREAATGAVFAAWAMLKRDPGNGIAWVAENFGRQFAGTRQAHDVLRQVAQALKVSAGGSTAAPEQQNGQATVLDDQTAARIAALEAAHVAQANAAQMSQQRQIQEVAGKAEAKLQAFTDAKDDAGNLLHPHFAAVRPVMGAMLTTAAQSGEELTLEEAYSRAVWSRDDLRDGLIKAQQEQAAKAAAAKGREAVARARAARSPRTPSVPAGMSTEDSPTDTGAILERAWDEQAGTRH